MAEVGTSMSSCKKRKEHKEEKPSRLKADELAVERVVTTLSMWHHPFKGDNDDLLTNFASGVTASDQVKTDLTKARHWHGKGSGFCEGSTGVRNCAFS